MRTSIHIVMLICSVVAGLLHPLEASPTIVAVVVEMHTPPVAVVYAAARARGTQAAHETTARTLRTISQHQSRLASRIRSLDGVVLARMQRAYNGLIVLIPERNLAAMHTLDGVRSVHPAVRHKPSLARSVPSIRAPGAWISANGLTGRGMRIAVVDTGVDYTHADFGGAGTPAAYTAARANSTVLEPGTGFPSAKLPAGIDLVGDRYNADNPATSVPVADPDPLDCYGHGTHVASTAAGFGVDADGTSYRGPYDASTPFDSLRVGPGVAPEALVVPVKIFGCAGSTLLTPAAIDWALDPNGDGDLSDRVDVINLSLGSALGSGYDATTVAADNAALAGTVVVASAGNDGDTTFTTSTPGSADRAISVAAGSDTTMASFSSRGPRRGDAALKPDLSAPSVGIYAAANGRGSEGTYLSGTSMAAPHVAGAAALLRQAHPDWTVEAIKAALLNTATDVYRMDDAPYSPLRSGTGRVDVANAVRTDVVAWGADENGRVGLSFGSIEVVDRTVVTRNVRVVNHGTTAQTFTVIATPTLTTTGVKVRPLVERLTVVPGGSATVPVQLDIADARRVEPASDATMYPTALGERRHQLGEVAGSIVFRPTAPDGLALQVPYFAVLRQAATIHAVPTIADDAVTLRWRGTSSLTTTLASSYELQHRSPKRLPSPTEQPGALLLGEAADVQYVGVSSDGLGIADSTVSFGLATYAPWSTPGELRVVVEVDADRDGDWDHRVETYDGGPGGVGGLGDAFLLRVVDLADGTSEQIGRVNFADPAFPGAIYHSRVMGFAVPAAALDLAATRFDYRVVTYHRDVLNERGVEVIADQTPRLSYDITRPGVRTTVAPVLVAGTPIRAITDTTRIVLPLNPANLSRNRSLGVLMLHHTNVVAEQAQDIPIAAENDGDARVYLPLVRR